MTQTTSPRTLKEKQRQEREALILQAAEEVLMEKGYHETSIDEIASRVGIAKGTVYLHFASKEDLVFALFAQDLEKFQQLVDSTVASELTARAKMEAILHVLYGSFFSKRFQLLYSLSNSADLRRIFVEKKGCMREMWEQISALITILLEEGKADGEFDTTIPTSVMLSAFFSLLSPKSYDRLMIEGQMSQEEVSRQLGRIYFKGIAAVDT
jgi:TetR/AcrR family transcriptional regulator, fatty acid metabolism regulator protein